MLSCVKALRSHVDTYQRLVLEVTVRAHATLALYEADTCQQRTRARTRGPHSCSISLALRTAYTHTPAKTALYGIHLQT